MRIKTRLFHLAVWAAGGCLSIGLLWPQAAGAHCDTLEGPVVTAARTALSKGNITPVLKWVHKSDENELQAAFALALKVLAKGKEARELADRYFFETVVRVHRTGEGAPFTGLLPAGTDPGPAVKGADLALQTGAVEPLVKWLTKEVAAGVEKRFTLAAEKKAEADASVDAGRDFVNAYVELVHYVEKLYQDAVGTAASQAPAAGAEAHGHKHH